MAYVEKCPHRLVDALFCLSIMQNQCLEEQLKGNRAVNAGQLAEANAARKAAERAHERESNSRLEAERSLLQLESTHKTAVADFEAKIVKKDRVRLR